MVATKRMKAGWIFFFVFVVAALPLRRITSYNVCYTKLLRFYLQDSAGDADAATSDGIFVYAPDAPDVDPGDSVRVRGTVEEFAGETEIARVRQVTRCSTGHAVAPIPIRLPASRRDAFESFEGRNNFV